MNISVEIIPHSEQRYDTVGDWFFDKKGNLQIRVSKMENWKYETLIALHEAFEAVLCKDNGVSEEAVTDFDIQFEKTRIEGNTAEPGDSRKAPYHKYHFLATTIERLQAQALDVDWQKYEEAVIAL